jgi:DNA processing protein
MEDVESLRDWLVLARVPALHAELLEQLCQQIGSIEDVCRAKPADLIAVGASEKITAYITDHDESQLAKDLRWLEQPGYAFVSYFSSQYPVLLKQLRHPPIGLFVRGSTAELSSPQLAIVGTRNPTNLGRETAQAFAAHLARCGLTITSGLAVGIDAASHEGALQANGRTIAVCATGLDSIYPRSHAKLAEQICEHGALVSQFPPNTPMVKYLFPLRNRVISGLSLGTLVVEAAVHSGSLITARFAAEQGREVFAIPGSIHNTLARGCHQLIRHGAKLVESAEDILSELGPLASIAASGATVGARGFATEITESKADSVASLDKDYKILLDALGFDSVGVDQLVARTGFKTEAIASMLLILELEGHVDSQPGGLYARTLATAKNSLTRRHE